MTAALITGLFRTEMHEERLVCDYWLVNDSHHERCPFPWFLTPLLQPSLSGWCGGYVIRGQLYRFLANSIFLLRTRILFSFMAFLKLLITLGEQPMSKKNDKLWEVSEAFQNLTVVILDHQGEWGLGSFHCLSSRQLCWLCNQWFYCWGWGEVGWGIFNPLLSLGCFVLFICPFSQFVEVLLYI